MSFSSEVLDMIQQRQGYIYTSIPAKVLSYNSTNQTIVCEIVIKRPYVTTYADDSVLLKDVPVGFYYGGDWVIASPLKKNDAVLLVFPMFDINNWLVGDKSTVYNPDGFRFHNIDGAFALPVAFTYNSPTRDSRFKDKFHIVKGDNYITMGDDGIDIVSGSTQVLIDKSGDVTVNTTHCTINADTTINGHLQIQGTFNADGIGGTGTSTGTLTGNLEVDGTITDNNTNLTTHYHIDGDNENTSQPL